MIQVRLETRRTLQPNHRAARASAGLLGRAVRAAARVSKLRPPQRDARQRRRRIGENVFGGRRRLARGQARWDAAVSRRGRSRVATRTQSRRLAPSHRVRAAGPHNRGGGGAGLDLPARERERDESSGAADDGPPSAVCYCFRGCSGSARPQRCCRPPALAAGPCRMPLLQARSEQRCGCSDATCRRRPHPLGCPAAPCSSRGLLPLQRHHPQPRRLHHAPSAQSPHLRPLAPARLDATPPPPSPLGWRGVVLAVRHGPGRGAGGAARPGPWC
jgi:hypothetical protein